MRYQIFNSRKAEAKPAMSAPWQWLAFSLANLLSLKWPLCRIVDAKTGEILMEWIRAERALLLGEENAAIASVKIGPDGSTHTFLMGSTHYGMSMQLDCAVPGVKHHGRRPDGVFVPVVFIDSRGEYSKTDIERMVAERLEETQRLRTEGHTVED